MITTTELEAALKTAMVKRDEVRVRTLRSLKAALQSREIERGRGTLTADDILAVLKKQARQRKEAMEQYEDARPDLFEREQQELAVIEAYLPEDLSADELESIVEEAIRSTGAQSKKDFGRVMGAAMKAVKGRADGNVVKEVVSRLLE